MHTKKKKKRSIAKNIATENKLGKEAYSVEIATNGRNDTRSETTERENIKMLHVVFFRSHKNE